MEFARLLILAEERLLGRGFASLLASRFDTHAIESFPRAQRLLGSGREEIALWVGDRVDAETAEELDALARAYPGVRLCMLARSADAEVVRALLSRPPKGVALLLRSDGLDVADLVASLNEVLAGRSTVEPRIIDRLVEEGSPDEILARLTPAERETLALVAAGLRNREIARRLWRSEKTVEKHVGRVFEKLGLDRSSAARLDRRVAAARIFFSCMPGGARDAAVGQSP